jgi:hypothetical protein
MIALHPFQADARAAVETAAVARQRWQLVAWATEFGKTVRVAHVIAPPRPHSPALQVWQPGDWATPDKLVCGRYWVTLATRPHRPDTPPIADAAGPEAGPVEEDHR